MTTTTPHEIPPGTTLTPVDLAEGMAAAIVSDHEEHAGIPFVIEAILESGNIRVRWPDEGLTTFDPTTVTLVSV